MGRRPRRKVENRLETKQMKLTKETLKRIIKEEQEKAMVNEIGGVSIPGTSVEDGLRDFLSNVRRGIKISSQECEMRRKAAEGLEDEQLKADVIAACDMIQNPNKFGHRGTKPLGEQYE